MKCFLRHCLPLPRPSFQGVVVRSPAPEEQGSKSSREVRMRFFALENSSRGSAHDVPDTSVLNGRASGVKTIVTAGADDNQNSG